MQQDLVVDVKDEGEGGIKNDFLVSDLYHWLNGEALS